MAQSSTQQILLPLSPLSPTGSLKSKQTIHHLIKHLDDQ